MKHIRITLAALLALGSASVVAAQQAPNPAHRGAHAVRGKHAGPRVRAGRALFRGITLSDAEKANLKAAHENAAKQRQALREQLKPLREAMREARQRHDTAAMRALWEKAAPQREAMKRLAETQRADIRAALTPENQAKFDANLADLQKRMAQRGDSARKRFARPGARSR